MSSQTPVPPKSSAFFSRKASFWKPLLGLALASVSVVWAFQLKPGVIAHVEADTPAASRPSSLPSATGTAATVSREETIVLVVEGMHCGSCAQSITEALEGIKGVKAIDVRLEPPQATIRFLPNETNVAALIEGIKKAGYKASLPVSSVPSAGRNAAPAGLQKAVLRIAGMHCGSCVARIQKVLGATPGILRVSVTLEPPQAIVIFDPQRFQAATLDTLLRRTGYRLEGEPLISKP